MVALASSTDASAPAADPPRLRVFVSSPQDVAAERAAVARAAASVNHRLGERARVELVLWEENSYSARGDFQSQIDDPARCDALVAILWGRYGSPLGGSFREKGQRPRFQSGTAFEIDAALAARAQDVYIFRKSETVFATLQDAAAFEEARDQYADLQAYVENLTRTEQGASKRAINQFSTTEEFEEKARKLLETLVARKLASQRRVVWDPADDRSPFPGLSAYDVADSSLFFGRSRKTDVAIEALVKAQARRRGFLIIVGPSGSGKSSLMRAGIAPRLLNGSAESGADAWRLAIMRPHDGQSPFVAMANAVLGVAAPRQLGPATAGPGRPALALPELAEFGFSDGEILARNWAALGREIAVAAQAGAKKGRSLFDLLDAGLPVASAVTGPVERALDRIGADLGHQWGYRKPATVSLLLMIDQMEELFSGAASPGEPVQDEARREAFAAVLAALVATGRVAVVATFRADLYGRLLGSRSLLALKDAGASYDLALPGPGELQEIVVRSAEACGLVFERDAETGERLDERLLADAQGSNALPLLQYALDKLYASRVLSEAGASLTFAAYRELGGLSGAIDAVADKALDTLRASLGARVDQVLPPLVRSLIAWVPSDTGSAQDEGSMVARQVRLDRRTADPALCEVVDALVTARVLVAAQDAADAGVATLRVAHERVLDAWGVAAEIKRRSRAGIRDRDRIAAQFAEWNQTGRQDDRLIQPGARLSEALDHLAEYKAEIEPAIGAYIALSKTAADRDRTRRRRLRLAFQIAAAVALVSGLGMAGAGWFAISNSRLARENYQLARDVVGNLIREFTGGLADVQGLPVRTVDRVLGAVAPMVDTLSGRGPEDPELGRIAGTLHYQFSTLYRDIDLGKALAESDRSFLVRQRLFNAERDRRAFAEDMAESWELRGDLDRKLPVTGDVAETAARHRAAYENSLRLRRAIYDASGRDPASRYGMSLSLVRLGDLLDRSGALDDALERYREARGLIEPALAAEPANRAFLREASWIAGKIGDILLRRARQPGGGGGLDPQVAVARVRYVEGLCLRHALFAADRTSQLAQRDVAFALRRLGHAEQFRGSIADTLAARFEELSARRALVEDNRGHALLQRELAQTLAEIVGSLRSLSPNDLAPPLKYALEARGVLSRLQALEDRMSDGDQRLRADIEKAITQLTPEGGEAGALTRVADTVALSLEGYYAGRRPTAELCPLR